MAKPSLQASKAGQQLAEQSLTLLGLTKKSLSNEVGCSRQPVTNFFKGVAIEQGLFVKLCDRLSLDWQVVAGLTSITEPAAAKFSELKDLQDESKEKDIDTLVRSLRQTAKDNLYERCGTLRVIDMSEPIGLNQVYTDVNILEQVSSHQRLRVQDLQSKTHQEDFERIGFGVVAQPRVPVMSAVAEHKKLIVLGKPGAGKTTFLKHLAIECIDGRFESERLPLFVNLKQFADNRSRLGLLAFLSQRHFENEMIALKDTDLETASLELEQVLNAGRALLLLDGLDEVNQSTQDWVLWELRLFCEVFHNNHFLMTCRVAAWEYTFEQFTEVEIADFNWPQIEAFARHWFANRAIQSEAFLRSLKRQPHLAQLAVTPLLLTLLCLAFESSGSLPSSRSELYREGIETLLKKWDASRGIHRDQVYKRLSTKRKEDLLSYIAIETFPDECFFHQRDVEHLITDYIRKLPEASEDPGVLQVDSTMVLHSIEAHHGLLVERAKHCYSFSHLTFHEYFVARELVYNSNNLKETLSKLVDDHALDAYWQEIFLLVSELLRDADLLLLPLQNRVNALMAESAKLQSFLVEVAQQAEQLQSFLTRLYQKTEQPFNLLEPAAIRAFFFDIDFDIDENRAIAIGLGPAANWLVCASFLTRMLDGVGLEKAIAQVISYDEQQTAQSEIAQARTADDAMIVAIEIALTSQQLDVESRQQLAAIRAQFSQSNKSEEAVKAAADAGRHIAKQRYRLAQQRPFSPHEFSPQETTKKEQYYKATKLLLDCLNSDGCMLTPQRRQTIKDGLFMPVGS